MSGDEPQQPQPQPGWPERALVLAAVERAQLHAPPTRDRQPSDTRAAPAPAPAPARESGPPSRGGGVALGAIRAHLGLTARAGAARSLRARLRELLDAGELARSRRNGVETWALAPAGRTRLAALRATGAAPVLGESPQHRAWREARGLAAHELERMRRATAGELERGIRMLAAERLAPSDAWLELAELLRASARRLASAVHCLEEWPEPADTVPDLDLRTDPGDELLDPARRARLRALRGGRRNVLLWRARP
jgi:hypothetical protein